MRCGAVGAGKVDGMENEFMLINAIDRQKDYIRELEGMSETYPRFYHRDLNVAHDELYNLEYRLRVLRGEVENDAD